MSNVTAYGVAYNIMHSPFRVTRWGYVFHFSSFSHMEKFKTNVLVKEEWLTDSMSRRFHFYVDCRLLADCQLYERLETRGFYVVSPSGEVIDSSDKMRLRVS